MIGSQDIAHIFRQGRRVRYMPNELPEAGILLFFVQKRGDVVRDLIGAWDLGLGA